MAQVGLGAITQTLQSDIISILNTDTTDVTYPDKAGTNVLASLSDFKIVDGIPIELLQGTGFKYIIVNTPEESTQRLTAGFSPQFISILEVPITATSKQEGHVRLVMDRIRQRLYNQRGTTRAHNFILHYSGGIMRNNVNPDVVGDNTRIWTNNIIVPYRWLGDSD